MTIQTKLMQAINLTQQYNRLNAQYSHASCFDYPQQYNNMESLQVAAGALIAELIKHNDISINGLSTAIENIAIDIDNGNIKPSARVTLYTQDEFIQYTIKRARMQHKEAERFNDMLNWMQEKERAGYLETRFILEWENDRNNNSKFFYDNRMSFVIVVE
jgi:hypothetical protein